MAEPLITYDDKAAIAYLHIRPMEDSYEGRVKRRFNFTQAGEEVFAVMLDSVIDTNILLGAEFIASSVEEALTRAVVVYEALKRHGQLGRPR